MSEDIPEVGAEGDAMKKEVDKVTTGMLGVLLFQLIIRFVRIQLFNIWFFVLVYPTVLLYLTVSKRGYFSLTPDMVTELIRIFSFGSVKNGTFDTGDVFHYLFLWLFVFSAIGAFIGWVTEKVTGKKQLIPTFTHAVVRRVKWSISTLLLLIIPTMVLYVLSFGWEGVFIIPLAYIFFMLPAQSGGVVVVTVLERAVMIIGEKYFGMRFDVETAER